MVLLLEEPFRAGDAPAAPPAPSSRALLLTAVVAAALALAALAAVLLRAGVIAPDQYPLRVMLPDSVSEALKIVIPKPTPLPVPEPAAATGELPLPAESLSLPATELAQPQDGALDPLRPAGAPPLAELDFDMARLPGSLRTDGEGPGEGGLLTVGKIVRLGAAASDRARLQVRPNSQLAIAVEDLSRVLAAAGRGDLVEAGELTASPEGFVDFEQIRGAGVDLRYNPVSDELELQVAGSLG